MTKTVKIGDGIAYRYAELSTFFAEYIPAWQARKKFPRPTVGETMELLEAFFYGGVDGLHRAILSQYTKLKREYPNAISASSEELEQGFQHFLEAWSKRSCFGTIGKEEEEE